MNGNGSYHRERPPAEPVHVCGCGRKCQSGGPGCHNVFVCPAHGLQHVTYPGGVWCTHAKTLLPTPPGQLVGIE